jgi:hypothetical protein
MDTKPRKNTYADVMKLDVEYAGVNPVKQHMFRNGVPLVTDVFFTLEEAFGRFGDRIQTHDKQYRLSAPFADGRKATKYAPRPGAKGQEQIEYALGYIAGIKERAKPLVAVVAKDSFQVKAAKDGPPIVFKSAPVPVAPSPTPPADDEFIETEAPPMQLPPMPPPSRPANVPPGPPSVLGKGFLAKVAEINGRRPRGRPRKAQ